MNENESAKIDLLIKTINAKMEAADARMRSTDYGTEAIEQRAKRYEQQMARQSLEIRITVIIGIVTSVGLLKLLDFIYQ